MDPAQADGPRQSYVYAIGDADHRHVKIGHTNSPRRRLTGIQLTCPFPVSILWQTEGGMSLEYSLHEHFKDYRRHGEWFEFPAEQNAVELIGHAAEAITRGVPEPGSAVNAVSVVVDVIAGDDDDGPGLVEVLARQARALDAAVIFEGHLLNRLMQLEQRVSELDGQAAPGRQRFRPARHRAATRCDR